MLADCPPRTSPISAGILSMPRSVSYGFSNAVLRKANLRYMCHCEFAMKSLPSDELFKLVSLLYDVHKRCILLESSTHRCIQRKGLFAMPSSILRSYCRQRRRVVPSICRNPCSGYFSTMIFPSMPKSMDCPPRLLRAYDSSNTLPLLSMQRILFPPPPWRPRQRTRS